MRLKRMRIIKEMLCRLLERIVAAVNPITITSGIPSGAVRVGEHIGLYNTLIATIETLRGTGYTVTAGKTCYITDIYFDADILPSITAGAYIVQLYLKAGTAIIATISTSYYREASAVVSTGRSIHIKFATPRKIAAGTVLRFADIGNAAHYYSGGASWDGFER